MAEEDNSQDKTEEPSQRKLDKAAEDGQVLTSKEMFVFTSLIMGLMVLSSIPFFARDFLAIWKTFFLFDLEKSLAKRIRHGCPGAIALHRRVLQEFGENKFSGAILRSYLEHEHEPFEVLKNLKFTLKNDACVIIKVPNYDSVNRKIRKEKWCGFHFPDHVNQFTPKTLLKMVKDTNYEVLKFNFLDYLPTSDNMWMVVRPI